MDDGLSTADKNQILRGWSRDVNPDGLNQGRYDGWGMTSELQDEFDRLRKIAADRELAFRLARDDEEAPAELIPEPPLMPSSEINQDQTPPQDDLDDSQNSNLFEDLELKLRERRRAIAKARSDRAELVVVFEPKCIACGDQAPFPHVKAPCGHYFCEDCLKQNFKAGMSAELHWPPNCCGLPFNVEASLITQALLGQSMVSLYHNLKEEYQCVDRLYCCRLYCSAFIPERNRTMRYGRCQRCEAMTCCDCKERYLGSHVCSANTELAQVTRLAADKGWRECSNCSQIIERTYGCNHMTCHCGHEFCYQCGKDWNTRSVCTCGSEVNEGEEDMEEIDEEVEDVEDVEDVETVEVPVAVPEAVMQVEDMEEVHI